MELLPSVSILTPVYNRNKFLPLMKCNIQHFAYPKDKLEWVILDSLSKDGDEAEPLFKSKQEVEIASRELGIPINYKYERSALSIGKKRNMLVKMARYNHLINLDSDDIYFPHYITYSIRTLIDNKYGLVGSPGMLFVFPNDNYKMAGIQCGALRQVHEATMAFTKKHWKRMGGFDSSSRGEGAAMIDGCSEKIFGKTDITKLMICVCGDQNTISKDRFLEEQHLIKGVDYNNLKEIPQIKVLKEIFK